MYSFDGLHYVIDYKHILIMVILICRLLTCDAISDMMSAIRLINALTKADRCRECDGCNASPCGSCSQCEDNAICLATVCVDGLDRHQRKALRIKHAVYQEDEEQRNKTNDRLMREVYVRAHKNV